MSESTGALFLLRHAPGEFEDVDLVDAVAALLDRDQVSLQGEAARADLHARLGACREFNSDDLDVDAIKGNVDFVFSAIELTKDEIREYENKLWILSFYFYFSGVNSFTANHFS